MYGVMFDLRYVQLEAESWERMRRRSANECKKIRGAEKESERGRQRWKGLMREDVRREGGKRIRWE